MCISNLIVITPSENSHCSYFSTENSKHKETLSTYNYTRDPTCHYIKETERQ